jgi:hypothetical protein
MDPCEDCYYAIYNEEYEDFMCISHEGCIKDKNEEE